MEQQEQEVKKDVTITLTPATEALFKSFASRRATVMHERERTVAYWLEEALDRGYKGLTGSLDSAVKLRDQRGFAEEMSKLKKPVSKLETTDPNYAQDCATLALAHIAQVDALQRKYGIGGSEQEV